MSNLIQDAYEQICGDQREILVLREQVEKLTKEWDEYRLKYQIKADKSDTYSRKASTHEDTIEFATGYALSIANYLHQHFFDDVPQWRPLDDLIGLQTQISNMVTGIGEQLAALAEQNEKLKAERSSVWMVATNVCMMLFATKEDADQSQQGASTYTVPMEVPVFGAQLPDLASPVLNKYRTEGDADGR